MEVDRVSVVDRRLLSDYGRALSITRTASRSHHHESLTRLVRNSLTSRFLLRLSTILN